MSIAESVARIESLVRQNLASSGSNAQRKDSIQTAEQDWTSRRGGFQSDITQRFTPFYDDPNSDLSATAQTKSAFSGHQYVVRDHPLYHNVQRHTDGLYHCPWEADVACSHRPEKLKRIYGYI